MRKHFQKGLNPNSLLAALHTLTTNIIGQVDPPGPNKKKEDEDEEKMLRFVSVTPATARRDSSVKMGKVTLR